MPRHVIGIDEPGRKALLLGNEAVARGVVESGCHVAASYPGTPASEILTTLGLVADELGFYAEWSTNEMTAVEVASSLRPQVLRLLQAPGGELDDGPPYAHNLLRLR
ncbi:hypothetical protein CW700_02485 [Candidatus Bathyarchaeota archaeon]|nr:MAG: hypothetical protein CW700_02485 [Candidatus Bathyarchaeota archaeon]